MDLVITKGAFRKCRVFVDRLVRLRLRSSQSDCVLIQREDRPRHVPIGQAVILQGAERAAVADDDLTGDRFESGAKVLHRLERDDALALGIDAERLELLQVEHLLGDRDDQDLDAVHAQDGARAEGAGQPAEDRSVAHVVAVADRDQLTLEGQRAATERGVDLAAENHPDALTDLGPVELLNRLAVHHRAEAGVAHAALEERAEQRGGVAVAARARVVGVVGDHERTVLGIEAGGDGGRGLDGEVVVHHLVAPRPDVVGQRLGEGDVRRRDRPGR